MITGLLDRMIRLSNGEHWESFLKNGYQKSFINAILGKFKQQAMNRLNTNVKTVNTITYCRFPFLPKLSHDVNKSFIRANVSLAYYNLLKVKSV